MESREWDRDMKNRVEFNNDMKPLIASIMRILSDEMTDKQREWLSGGMIKIGINAYNGMGTGIEYQIK